MKKITSIILSAVLLISSLLLSSCGLYIGEESIFPEGYTGGLGIIGYGSKLELYWVETYEEVVAAMDLLKSHGSTFEESIISTYEGDLFDVKYCFTINGRRADYVKYGDNPYDRWAEDVRVTSYLFFEDISIDTLVYDYISDYDSIGIGLANCLDKDGNLIDLSIVELNYEWDETTGSKFTYATYEGKNVFSIFSNNGYVPSNECIDAIASSVEYIGIDK